jgi:hypothetical protein
MKEEYRMKIFTLTKLGRTLLLSAVVAVVSVSWLGCGGDNNPSSDQSSALNGTWLRGDSDSYYQFKIDGNNWVYSEGPSGNVSGYSKGTWSSNSTISAPSSGTFTLTVTHVSPYHDGNWMDFPPEYNSVKVNTATYDLNASASLLTIRDAVLTTSGVWGTLEGTYQKQ